jgi:ABC-type phosphate transport system substrate-binding protein
MKQLFLYVIFFICCNSVNAENIVVIANPNMQVNLTRFELVDIYMGRVTTAESGEKFLAIDNEKKPEIKAQFYQWLFNKNINQVNAYWARLLFSGRATPPFKAESSEQIIEIVKQTPMAIGYIESDKVTDDVKVIAHVD